jgi:uncharacterized protein
MNMIDTPCIGICSTVYGDRVCRGCKRYDHEVIAWNGLDKNEKEIIYQRLEDNLSSILFHYIEVIDESLLQKKVTHLQLRLRTNASTLEQAFHLLRLGVDKIKHIERYGIRVKTEFAHLPLPILFNQIDAQLYILAKNSRNLE